VSCAVFSLVSVAVVDQVSFRLILLLLATFICVNSFLSTNLSSFLLPGCRLLMLCCLVLCGMLAEWSKHVVEHKLMNYSCADGEFYWLLKNNYNNSAYITQSLSRKQFKSDVRKYPFNLTSFNVGL
jgi:hypothetical protein